MKGLGVFREIMQTMFSIALNMCCYVPFCVFEQGTQAFTERREGGGREEGTEGGLASSNNQKAVVLMLL